MDDKITTYIDFEIFKVKKECFYFRLNQMYFSFITPNVIAISENDVDMIGSISFDGNVPPFMDRFELAYAISKYGINEGIKRYGEKGLEPFEKEALELLIQDNQKLMRNDEFINTHLNPNGGNENE